MLSVVTISLILPKSSYGITTDRVLATVDDEIIILSDYLFFVRSLGVPENGSVVEEKLLKRLMEEKLILHEAKRRELKVSDTEVDTMIEDIRKQSALSREDFERKLAYEGLDMGSYKKILKDTIMMQKLIETEVDSKIMISDKEVETFYHFNQRDFLKSPDQVDVGLLFLRLSDDATVTEVTDLIRKVLKITSQLNNGVKFETLILQYNQKQTKSDGGRIGTFKKGELIAPLDQKIFSMKVGELSEPIWVKEGVYIVKLVGRSNETFKSLDEVKEEIYGHLYKERKNKLFNEWVKTLWEKASTRIN